VLLVLIPYFAFQVLDQELGDGTLARMFFVERAPLERAGVIPSTPAEPSADHPR
jgi:hypothetical protein